MRISEPMIQYYLGTVTVGYFNDQDLPPNDVKSYECLVSTIRQKAVKHADMEHLHIALAWLLTNKEVDLQTFNGGRYPFDSEEMFDIICYIYNSLYPEKGYPAEELLKRVELVDVSLEDWWKARK